MTTQRIVLVIGEANWTIKAVHLAATIARREQREMVIVKMLPVQHTGWLGAPEEFADVTRDERKLIAECVATVDDYGIPTTVGYFQYADLSEAIRQAAELYQASAMFATLPPSRIALWGKFQVSHLEHQLRQQHCALYNLAPANVQDDWTPSVVVQS